MEPKPKISLKVADKPHYWTIGLSVAALLVSCLSWYESHKGRLISLSSNRAVLYVTDFYITDSPDDDDFVASNIVVKNLGRSPAQAIRTSFHYLGSYEGIKEEDYKETEMDQLWFDLPPGIQKVYGFSASHAKAHMVSNRTVKIYFIGVLSYIDEASGNEYKQRWCFEILDGRKTKPCN